MMKKIFLGLTFVGGATILLTIFYVLNPDRKNGFGSIGMEKELRWRKRVGLPTNDPGLPAN